MISFGCDVAHFHTYSQTLAHTHSQHIHSDRAELFKFIIICNYFSTEDTISHTSYSFISSCRSWLVPLTPDSTQPWLLIQLNWCDIKRSSQCNFPLSFCRFDFYQFLSVLLLSGSSLIFVPKIDHYLHNQMHTTSNTAINGNRISKDSLGELWIPRRISSSLPLNLNLHSNQMILMAQLTDEVYIISFGKHKMTIRLGFRLKAEIVRTFSSPQTYARREQSMFWCRLEYSLNNIHYGDGVWYGWLNLIWISWQWLCECVYFGTTNTCGPNFSIIQIVGCICSTANVRVCFGIQSKMMILNHCVSVRVYGMDDIDPD